jgi:microcystin degradation protein MlrC
VREAVETASSPSPGRRFRIAIAGLGSENDTFSPHRTRLEDFIAVGGSELAARYQFVVDNPYPDVQWLPAFYASADSGGPIEPSAYDQLEAELLARLTAFGEIDGLLFDIEGAMSVAGRDSCEEGLIERIRAVIGEGPLVAASMDPHGNLSRRLAGQLDIITVHRLSPHEDAAQTAARAARDLVYCLRRGERPVTAWTSIPVLLNGEMTSTRVEPGKSVFSHIDSECARDEILDAGLWVGYSWADEPRCRAAATATGFDEDAVKASAERLARAYWDARAEFSVVAPASGSAEECLAAAAASTKSPFFITDSGDNVTAGAAGDNPQLLRAAVASRELAEAGKSALFVSIVDPETVAECVAAGVGARLRVNVGAKLETRYGSPVELDATVLGLAQLEESPATKIAVIRSRNVDVAVTDRRLPFITEEPFVAAGLNASEYDVVVPKCGYMFPYHWSIAAEWWMALTEGATQLDLRSLAYQRVERPVYPLDTDFPSPSLEPVILRGGGDL